MTTNFQIILAGLHKKVNLDRYGLLITNRDNIAYFSGYPYLYQADRDAYILIYQKKIYFITYSLIDKTKITNTLCEYIVIPPNHDVYFILNLLIKQNQIKNLLIEDDDLTLAEYNQLSKKVKIDLHKLTNSIKDLRSVKSDYEINYIKNACRLTDEVLFFMIKNISAGVSELEIKISLENSIKRKNCQLAFDPVVAFGKNSAIPHHQANSTKLKKEDIILIDIGAKYANYCTDITRVFFYGQPKKEWLDIYQKVSNAQDKAIALLKPGINGKEIDLQVKQFLKSYGYPPYEHGLGHGVGVAIHENPRLNFKKNHLLKDKSVFTVEPGIYLTNHIGVRLEDVVLLENGKAKILTKFSKELKDIIIK